jgi:GST-like protein
MIDLYTYKTPNGRKPAILLEELQLPYIIHKVDLSKGEQFSPEFVALNPNSKIPVLSDRDTGITVFESGAMLIYLAEKTGKFLPTEPKSRANVLQWLMFQKANIGPIFGQLAHFRNAAPEKLDYPLERYQKETSRLLGVLEQQLSTYPYLAKDYSIADIATYPWVVIAAPHLGLPLQQFPHVLTWMKQMEMRPAVQKGMAILTPEFSSDYGT